MRKDGAIDIKMAAACKERFAELYALSQEDRKGLRNQDAYRQALLDIYEMAVQASGMAENDHEFYILLGKVTYNLINEKVQITENQL